MSSSQTSTRVSVRFSINHGCASNRLGKTGMSSSSRMSFLAGLFPPMWVNKSTGEAILPGNTSYYLNYNIHKYATSMISEGNPFVYYSNLYESDVVRFTPMFEVKNSGYFHRANEEMFPMTAEATFTSEVSGKTVTSSEPDLFDFPPQGAGYFNFDDYVFPIYGISPCDKGVIEVSVTVVPTGETFVSDAV